MFEDGAELLGLGPAPVTWAHVGNTEKCLVSSASFSVVYVGTLGTADSRCKCIQCYLADCAAV